MWLVDRTGAGSGVERVVGSWAAGEGHLRSLPREMCCAVCGEQRSRAHATSSRAFAGGRAARVQMARSKTRERTLFARAIASRARQSPTVHVALTWITVRSESVRMKKV